MANELISEVSSGALKVGRCGAEASRKAASHLGPGLDGRGVEMAVGGLGLERIRTRTDRPSTRPAAKTYLNRVRPKALRMLTNTAFCETSGRMRREASRARVQKPSPGSHLSLEMPVVVDV